MAEPFLPAEILKARKQGFASPVPAWMRGALGAETLALLTQPRALKRGWWTRSGIERLAAEPSRHAFRLYQLLMLELTVRLHVEDRALAAPSDGLEALAA